MEINKKSLINRLLSARDFILDLIFPIECLCCGQEGVWLCKKCFRQLPIDKEQYCLNCRQPNAFGQFCQNCAPAYSLNGVWIAGNYQDKTIISLIKNLKYHFAKDLSEILGEFLSLFLRNLINKGRINSADLITGINRDTFEKIKKTPEILLDLKNSILIPVPLHKRRQRWRGFNQTEAITRTVSEYFNLKMSNDLMRKKHRTPQTKLGKKKRRQNIQNCFSWRGGNLKDVKIILIDDVTTTGSTLNECAKVLKQAGAKEVWGLAVANG